MSDSSVATVIPLRAALAFALIAMSACQDTNDSGSEVMAKFIKVEEDWVEHRMLTPGKSEDWAFTVENVSKGDVHLRINTKSCSCIISVIEDPVLASGQSTQVILSTVPATTKQVQGWGLLSAQPSSGEEEELLMLNLVGIVDMPTGLSVVPTAVRWPSDGKLFVDVRLSSACTTDGIDEVLDGLELAPVGEIVGVAYSTRTKDGALGFGLMIQLPDDDTVDEIMISLAGYECAYARIRMDR